MLARRSGPCRQRCRRAGARRPARWALFAVACAQAARSLPAAWRGGPALRPSPPAFVPKSLFPKSYLDRASLKRRQASAIPVIRDLKVVVLFAAAGYLACYSSQRWMGAPDVPQIRQKQPPSPNVGALLAAGLYGANVAYNVLNKRVLLAYPHPVVVTTMNLLTCSLCCVMAWAAGISRAPPRPTREHARLLPLVLFHWAGIFLANVSVSEVNISFTHTVKAAEPVFTAVFAMALLGTAISSRDWLYLMLVCAGVALASTTELSFTWLGFWAAMASNVTVSLRTVLSKKLIDDKMIQDPMSFIMVLHCGAFVISLVVALVLEGTAVLKAFSSPILASGLAIGPLVWVFNTASILVLSRTSPVAHSMIRALRRPILVLASIIAFGTAMNALNVGGVIAALVGVWLFNSGSDSEGQKLQCGGASMPRIPSRLLRETEDQAA
mmetsp:Transcript_39002/g.121505  ORF Transcript_39002/g.121505 Transcript_39002/m.121505 type:complete len:439 (+) Transcript_39002:77-1393(+)